MELTPELQTRLRLLLEDELRAAWDAARAAGAPPAALAEIVECRRRALESTTVLGEDPEYRGDDPIDNHGVCE